MGWETQGRRYNQWFGHGAAGVVAPARDLADAVGDAAVAALGGERGAALAGAFRDGGTGWLREAFAGLGGGFGHGGKQVQKSGDGAGDAGRGCRVAEGWAGADSGSVRSILGLVARAVG